MPFVYPTSVEMRTIEPDLISRGRAGRLGLDLLPMRPVNAAKVRWTQRDNYYGLQQIRGMDGSPVHVNRVGKKSYEYEPGVYGEFIDITETELTTRAGSVDIPSVPIDVSDLVVESDDLLINRELDRIESIIWDLLVNGTITVLGPGENGPVIMYQDTYQIQTYTATIPWSTAATSTPFLNFQAVQQLGVGHSVDLGAGARAIMNTVTANHLVNNANAADLSGRRNDYGATYNDLTSVNQFLVARNLPRAEIYDQGYIPSASGTGTGPAFTDTKFKKFIPDNKVIVIGKRPSGVNVGEYQVTRNASADYRPQSYRYVIDRANGINGEKRTPANLEIHRGHNGGPAIYYPSAVVVMNV